jgi:hypothetical protein
MTKVLGWLGTVASIIGSFLIAFGIIPAGYVCFVVGSVAWLIVAGLTANAPLATLNLFFLMANAIGIYRSF